MSFPAATHPVKALIFDMDGTMVDSMPYHQSTWLDFARKQGVVWGSETLTQSTTGRTGAEAVRLLLNAPDMDEAAAVALVQEKEQLYRAVFDPIFTEVQGFTSFYTAARQRGLKIAIGTAGDIHNVEFVLGHLQLHPPPDAIARGDEGLSGKPTPAIFLKAAERLSVSAEDCIVFEDAPFGIEAARRAGMRAVAICTGHRPQELAGPHVVATARNYTELLESHFLESLHVAT